VLVFLLPVFQYRIVNRGNCILQLNKVLLLDSVLTWQLATSQQRPAAHVAEPSSRQVVELQHAVLQSCTFTAKILIFWAISYISAPYANVRQTRLI